MADLGRTAQTAEASTVHKPFGKPGGPGLWHTGKQLPAYIQSVAHHLVTQGHDTSHAIGEAVGIVKNWAHGHDGHGNPVHPDVQAAAVKAIAEWEKLRAQAHSDNRSGARRSAVTAGPEYDSDGLDGSWDGDHSDLPDLTGLGVPDLEAAAGPYEGPASRAGSMALGKGGRFAKLKSSLAAKGASDPGALAAFIGKRKYGKGKFTQLASAARKRKGGGSASRSAPGDLLRFYPLEDIHILTRAEGDASGTLVEAYATVFDEPAEIHDHQGHYMEVIDRGAFDQVLARIRAHGSFASAVKVLYNHGKTMEGQPAPEYQIPIGVPEDIRPEKRGLLTRTRYDAGDPFAERILSKVRSGAITAQSFVGGIVRSSPELRGPGDRFRRRNGELTSVRRMVLGLREYGPVLFPAYSGAEILGVRMQLPGDPADEGAPDYAQDEEFAPGMEGDGAGGIPEEVHPSRYHKHRLYQMQTEPLLRKAGIVLPGRD